MNNKISIKKILVSVVIFLSVLFAMFFGSDSSKTKKENAFRDAELNAVNGIQTIVFTDGVYAGNIIDQRLEGIGKYVLDTGDYYDGEWFGNLPNGEGRLKIDGVGIYEGAIVDGKRDGDGTFHTADGIIVEGKWRNDKLVDDFKITYNDSEFFEGHMSVAGEGYDGLYTIINEDGICEFSISNSKTSYLTFYFNSGTKCSGPIVDGKFNGTCTIKYYNGDLYVGSILNNMRDGHGKYTFNSPEGTAEESTFEGTWKDDQFIDGTYSYNYYEKVSGTFVNNKPEGECVYYKSGQKYITTWTNGKCVKIEKVGG